MRVFNDLSGNGMGAAFTQQAFLEEEIDNDNLISESVRVNGNFNVSIQGNLVGSISVTRSLDNGESWEVLTALSEPITFSSDVSESFYEPEPQALYRFECTAYTSGSAMCRIGK